MKKPQALLPGDKVVIVAPGSPISPERLEMGVMELRRLGYVVDHRPDIISTDTFFAGAHERRYQEFHDALHDSSVRAIVCARGGYGSNYVIERLAAGALPAHPKIVMGYSDVTTMLAWLTLQAGWVTFHGPMVTLEFAEGAAAYDCRSLLHALSGDSPEWDTGDAGARVLREGTAEGVLFGGCLPMLVASLGTVREVQTAGCLLFLEDIASKPYQIDRMLFQMREAGKLDDVRAIIFGEMLDCMQHAQQGYRLEDVVMRCLAGIDVPVVYGFRSGHTSRGNVTLPIGVRARLDATDSVSLRILERAVEPPS